MWSALVATLLHVALLSLHVTASFERAIAAPGDAVNLSVHALCGPGALGPLTDYGSKLPSGKAAASCPLCTGAAPLACAQAPESSVVPIVFTAFAAPQTVAASLPSLRRLHSAGTIRGPPIPA